MSKRINILLPDETVSVLDRAATKGTRSAFISKAVLHYVETQGREALREQLKAGYRANNKESLALATEWLLLEEEAPSRLKGRWAASKRRGADKLTMRQINAEVAAARKDLRKAKANTKRPAK